MRPLVSIVTPVYNHEHFIGKCIESVIAQTHEDWEMVLVDDGSSDGSVNVIRSYKDKRLKLICQENQGIERLGETYNKAVAASDGAVVGILEGDDLWPPYKLEIQVKDFEDEAVALSSGMTAIVDTDGEFMSFTPVTALTSEARTNQPPGVALKTMLHPQGLTYTYPVATVLRRQALERAGGFTQPAGMVIVDMPTFARVALEGEFRFHYDVCGIWRRHQSSMTHSRNSAILESCYTEVYDFLRANRKGLPWDAADFEALDKAWQNFMGQLCMLRGRMLASQHEWKLAAKAFGEGLLYDRSVPMTVAMRSSGLLSHCRLPSEWLFRAYGRPDWRRVAVVASGDWIVSLDDMNHPRPVPHHMCGPA